MNKSEFIKLLQEIESDKEIFLYGEKDSLITPNIYVNDEGFIIIEQPCEL